MCNFTLSFACNSLSHLTVFILIYIFSRLLPFSWLFRDFVVVFFCYCYCSFSWGCHILLNLFFVMIPSFKDKTLISISLACLEITRIQAYVHIHDIYIGICACICAYNFTTHCCLCWNLAFSFLLIFCLFIFNMVVIYILLRFHISLFCFFFLHSA